MRDQHTITGPIEPEATTPSSMPVDPAARGRQEYFDNYWNTRNLTTVDHRTRLRVGLVDNLLTHRSGQLLDVGCGRGCTAAYFADLGFDVSAVDLSPMAVEWTRRQHHRIRATVLDLETEPIIGWFDVILCLEVLQQVRQPAEVLCKLVTALNPGGELIISLPNEFHLARRFNILSGRINFGGIEDSHIKLFTVDEQKRLLQACGLEICAQRVQSIIPPAWWGGRLHSMSNGLASRVPNLLALSVIYKCMVGSARRSLFDDDQALKNTAGTARPTR